VLNGPVDLNWYPLAPLGCKAVVYEDGDTCGSWASRGVDRWYLGPSKKHYRCNLYFIPETRVYRISGSAELFPQHCQIPCLTKHKHFWALTEELAKVAEEANVMPAGRRLIKTLQMKIKHALNPPDVQEEQRVREQEQRVARENEQRVIDDTPILTILCITDAPAIMQSRNPMAKRMLQNNPRVHRRVTRHNTPGALLLITRRRGDINNEAQGHRRSLQIRQMVAMSTILATPPPVTFIPIPSGARQRVVMQQAINVLTIQEKVATNNAFKPTTLMEFVMMHGPTNFEHYCWNSQ
jgi:hypothetical protein